MDPSEPKTVLQIPKAEVIQGILNLWRQAKKPVDVVVVMDISGSMEGPRPRLPGPAWQISSTCLDDRDRIQVNLFNGSVTTLSPLSSLGEKRDDLKRRISGDFEGGETALDDDTSAADADLTANGDPNHIRAVVVLTDGLDTASYATLDDVTAAIGRSAEEGGNAIKFFTIVFGDDADETGSPWSLLPAGNQGIQELSRARSTPFTPTSPPSSRPGSCVHRTFKLSSNPVMLGTLGLVVVAGLCAAWWLFPIGLLVWAVMLLIYANDPWCRASITACRSAWRLCRSDFRPSLTRSRGSQVRLFNAINGSCWPPRAALGKSTWKSRR